MSTTTNPGWEERYEKIRAAVETRERKSCEPTKILNYLLSSHLITMDEYTRGWWKTQLLEPFIIRLVVNMVKGTVKYPTDDWPAEAWQDFGMDDTADSVNYSLLFQDKLRKAGKL